MARGFIDEIPEAIELNQTGNIDESIAVLLGAISEDPLALGVCDALYVLGQNYMALEQWHKLEKTCLMAYRFRASAVLEDSLFNSLVNLTRACINLKSPREGFTYGLIAESINDNDPELLGNMIILEVMLGLNEKTGREEKLKKKDISKVVYLNNWLTSDDPFWKSHKEDCGDLWGQINNFEKGIIQWIARKLNKKKGIQFLTEWADQLSHKPNGLLANKCWKKLTEVYASGAAAADPSSFNFIISYASATSAAGKAIYSDDRQAEGDAELWYWYGAGLGQMCLYDMAYNALEKCQKYNPNHPNIDDALQYIDEMNKLPGDSIRRPDSSAYYNEFFKQEYGMSIEEFKKGLTIPSLI